MSGRLLEGCEKIYNNIYTKVYICGMAPLISALKKAFLTTAIADSPLTEELLKKSIHYSTPSFISPFACVLTVFTILLSCKKYSTLFVYVKIYTNHRNSPQLFNIF
jgi:hypothetical protein